MEGIPDQVRNDTKMEYKGLIFTNHILERMKQRGLSYDDIYWVFSRPDEVYKASASGGKKYYRNWKGKRFSVVAKQNDEGKWIVLTCWAKDLHGAKPNDHWVGKKNKKKDNNDSFLKNMWKMISER
jgi:uncharacterized protein DUF4258